VPRSARRYVAAAVLTAALASVPAASARLSATTGFEPGNGRIVVARDDGSHRRVLASGDQSWISPDGKLVAVTDTDPGQQGSNPRFKVFRATGGPPLFVIRAGLWPAAWSPDSKSIVAPDSRNKRLVLIDAATGARTKLADGSFGWVAVSPDSTQVAAVLYSEDIGVRSSLVVIDLATRASRTIHTDVGQPIWGPSGIVFAAVTRRRGRMFENIATINPDGTGFRQLTHFDTPGRSDPTGVFPEAVSADGRRVLASWLGLRARTYVVDVENGGARLVARGVAPVAFTRDGRHVIGETGNPFCCAGGPVNVVRVPVDGGKQRILLRKAFAATRSG
jgi:hypothetical protein